MRLQTKKFIYLCYLDFVMKEEPHKVGKDIDEDFEDEENEEEFLEDFFEDND